MSWSCAMHLKKYHSHPFPLQLLKSVATTSLTNITLCFSLLCNSIFPAVLSFSVEIRVIHQEPRRTFSWLSPGKVWPFWAVMSGWPGYPWVPRVCWSHMSHLEMIKMIQFLGSSYSGTGYVWVHRRIWYNLTGYIANFTWSLAVT